MIHSSPEGAKVYIDDAYRGKTPYALRDTKIVGTKTDVRLTKENYAPLKTSITKDEKVDVGAVIGGCFIGVPFIWTMGYLPEHTYELTPIPGRSARP